MKVLIVELANIGTATCPWNDESKKEFSLEDWEIQMLEKGDVIWRENNSKALFLEDQEVN